MIIVGVNGGGTKTEVLCCDENGKIIGSGRAGSSNLHNIGLEDAVKAIKAAVSEATAEEPHVLCVGLAGIDTDREKKMIHARLSKEYGKVIVEHDGFAELYGETNGTPGILVIAGTGSIVLGYDGKKRYRRCNNGWFLGDEGSAYAIGKAALGVTAKMLLEDMSRSPIADAVMKELRIASAEELMEWAYYSNKNDVSSVAALAKAVCGAAEREDANACEIVNRASSALAEATCDLASKLDIKTVHMKGGLMNSRFYYSNFDRILKRDGIACKPILDSGAEGALMIAASSVGVKVVRA
jgi:glucosamine kinase